MLELSKDDLELMTLTDNYGKDFNNLIKENKKEHDERMKTEDDDRKRTVN